MKKNIGFVTTWLERGATYVTKTYMNLLRERHNLFVFSRGGEYSEEKKTTSSDHITQGYRLRGTEIDWRQISKWIETNNIDVILFNEQNDIECLLKIKKRYPHVVIGSYIDYYKEDTVSDFEVYDFLICNTKRHYSVFSWHPNVFYIPWGTDIELFNYNVNVEASNKLKFFHSMGMSPRKGTDTLIQAFINGKFYKENAELIIHTQKNIDHIISTENAKKYGSRIIQKEVPSPGLYHLGDVYVYPTTLDGLGLTIYEALSCGLPVITTNCAPLNEIINNEIGRLVNVDLIRCRKDAYYWPLSIVEETSLISSMQYYIDNHNKINDYKLKARKFAEQELNIRDRFDRVNNIFENTLPRQINLRDISNKINETKKNKKITLMREISEQVFPNVVKHLIRKRVEERRRYEM